MEPALDATVMVRENEKPATRRVVITLVNAVLDPVAEFDEFRQLSAERVLPTTTWRRIRRRTRRRMEDCTQPLSVAT